MTIEIEMSLNADGNKRYNSLPAAVKETRHLFDSSWQTVIPLISIWLNDEGQTISL